MTSKTYSEMHDEQLLDKYFELQKELPKFLKSYFIHIDSLLPSTKLNYATDLRVFFEWLRGTESDFLELPMRELPFEALKSLTHDDLNEYLVEYLHKYDKNGKTITNQSVGQARKLTTLKSMYKFYESTKLIVPDPTKALTVHNPYDEHIVYLKPNEVAKLLDCIESENPLFFSQKKEYQEKTPEAVEKIRKRMYTMHETNKARDLAIFTLLLSTGIRVSECVGLNVTDADFSEGELHVIRKGHRKDTTYISDEAQEALLSYLSVRETAYHPEIDEEAMFLGFGGKRLGVRQIEKMLKDYIRVALPARKDEKISPHKLRSTFAMEYYNNEESDEDPDALTLSNLLGHKNLSTVQKYAKASESKKRKAIKSIKLRG